MKEIEIASSFFCGVRKFFLFFVRRDERDEKTEKWQQKNEKIQKNFALFLLFFCALDTQTETHGTLSHAQIVYINFFSLQISLCFVR